MNYLSHYEETTPTSDRHAFFFKEGEKVVFIETYLGRAAALELGYFEDAEVGLNRMKAGSPTYTLILDHPETDQRRALELSLQALQDAHILGPAPLDEWTEGQREDFAGHEEADLFLHLFEQVELITSDPGALEMHTTTWSELKELLDEGLSEEEQQDKERRLQEYRLEEAQRERESLERGEAKLKAAREKQPPPERLLN